MLRLLLIVVGISSFQTSYCQQQASVWYFGNFLGLDFRGGGAPTPLANGAQINLEGMATISDSSGNLLYYSTGELAWNRQHQQLPNGFGLKGHWSTTQSALFVPKPGNPDLHYLFTVDAGKYIDDNVEGLHYSVVSLCADGGLGDIIPETKNQLLLSYTSEKISAVYHANGTDVWVLTHLMNSDKFYAYLVTHEGISQPVISSTGVYYSDRPLYGNTLGQLKFSPDGSKVGMIRLFDGAADVYRFDTMTGMVSGGISWYAPLGYGIEFSPDGSKAYVSHYERRRLSQYDLASGNAVDIQASEYILHEARDGEFSALQLGPDKKIYTNRLAVINNPNEIGQGASFEQTSVDFEALGAWPQIGLSGFVQSYFDPNPQIEYSNYCGSNTFNFRLLNRDSIVAVEWDFGDPMSSSNSSTEFFPVHNYPTPGSYLATATLTLKNGQIILKQKKVYYSEFKVNLGPDKVFCDVSGYELDATQPERACYLWNDGSTEPTRVARTTGLHVVDVRVGGCHYRDSVRLEFRQTPVANLGGDIILCEGKSQIITVPAARASYLWSTGEDTRSITVDSSGIYKVAVSSGPCVAEDSIQVSMESSPLNGLPVDVVACDGANIQITLPQNASYEWSNGEKGHTAVLSSPGSYWVKAFINDCRWRDTTEVHHIFPFSETQRDTSFCSGSSLMLDVFQPESGYSWSTGDAASILEVNEPGTYTVSVSNVCWETDVLFNVAEEDCECEVLLPNVFTPNADGRNDVFVASNGDGVSGYEIQLMNRWGKVISRWNGNQISWDGTVDGQEAATEIYYYLVRYFCDRGGVRISKEKHGYIHLIR